MADIVQLDLSVLLPEVHDSTDHCVERLGASLSSASGIQRVHVDQKERGGARLCIHYDRGAVSLDEVRRLALQSGAQLTTDIGHLLWTVKGISHERRARTVAETLRKLDGVYEAEASAAGSVRVEFDRHSSSEQLIEQALASLGVHRTEAGATSGHDHAHAGCAGGHSHDGPFGERTELVFALGAGAAYLAGLLVSVLTELPAGVSTAFYLAAYALGGYFTTREAIDSIRAGRFEVDFLMLIAAAGAAALGKWAEGAVLLFLFSLGHALEHYAMGRARKAIQALGELTPKVALVRRDNVEAEIPVESLVLGDLVIVRPNSRIAADGVVAAGASAVDQAPITGESIPVDKSAAADPAQALLSPEQVPAAHRVFAGTINGSGALEVLVTRLAEDNTLARVAQLVQEAETQRSPTQRFTDRFERVFVPSVVGLVVLLMFAWVVIDESFADSFYRAMAVLVASSPCALAISTPSAVLSGVARAARGGVLVKGGAPLESLGSLTAIAFDKTGTLTEGRPQLTDVLPAAGVDERELVAVAVAIEQQSDHPLAAAVVRDGIARLGGAHVPAATAIEAITGRGVRAVVGGEPAHVGSPQLFSEVGGTQLPADLAKQACELARRGRTAMVVRQGDRYLGVLGLMDTPRAEAADTISELRRVGIRRVVMLSGDDQRVADAVAEQLGLDEAWGGLMPEDKVAAIQRLVGQEGGSAMVGDGVNDAPAMANATVGIAMGAAGSDVALETADVALMADNLGQLPFATGLSRRTSRTIKQNLFVSLGMVAVLIPATLLGLGIGPAVAFHEGSTLLVVFNALRLLGYRG